MELWKIYTHGETDRYIGMVNGKLEKLGDTLIEYELFGQADKDFSVFCANSHTRNKPLTLLLTRNRDNKTFYGAFMINFVSDNIDNYTYIVELTSTGQIREIDPFQLRARTGSCTQS